MAKLNITQASKEAGISKNTLYAHMEKGIVSYEIDEDGRKWIDLSEIRRAYKNNGNGNATNKRSVERSTERSIDHEGSAKIERLYERRISQLEKQFDALQTENAKLAGILENQTRLLEYKSEGEEARPEPERSSRFKELAINALPTIGVVAFSLGLLLSLLMKPFRGLLF